MILFYFIGVDLILFYRYFTGIIFRFLFDLILLYRYEIIQAKMCKKDEGTPKIADLDQMDANPNKPKQIKKLKK